MAVGWTYREIDQMTWRETSDLLTFMEEHPPTHLLVQGIASGLSGQSIGRKKPRKIDDVQAPLPPSYLPNEIKSAEDLFGIITAANSVGLNAGIVQ